jgi:hypothetical protein
MNSAHAGALEQQFIAWVGDANRYIVTNGTVGGDEPLGPCDAAILDLFNGDIRSVALMAGIDVFEPDPLWLFFFDDQPRYRGAPAFKAKGRRDGDALLVLGGSTLPAPRAQETGYEFLDKLKDEGSVTQVDNIVNVVFDARIPFVGPLQNILGCHAHRWITANRRKLSSVLRGVSSDEDTDPAPDGDIATK